MEVKLWNSWEYKASDRSVKLLEVVKHLEATYHLSARDIFYGSIPLYMHALNGKDPEAALGKDSIVNITYPSASAESKSALNHIDLTVTFVDPKAPLDEETGSEKMLEGVPTVRVILPTANK